jgi:hypothetical protein
MAGSGTRNIPLTCLSCWCCALSQAKELDSAKAEKKQLEEEKVGGFDGDAADELKRLMAKIEALEDDRHEPLNPAHFLHFAF